jgi:peptidoglycan/LPS O-acetylase OafA/YrhL
VVFSFIFQFYAVYPLLSRAASRYGGAGLAILGAIGLVCTALLNPIAITYGQNLFFTPLGHLPVICLGMYFARTDDPRMPAGALIAAALVMVAGNWIEPLWYLMPLCMAILLLFMLQALHARMIGSGWPLRLVRYYGAISLPLFAVHGMLRGPFVELANAIGEWHTTIILGLMYLISATLAAQLMHMIERRGRLLMPRVLSS